MRARSVATQGSRNEFDLSYSNKCYILSRGCAHDRGCNICDGKLLVILRRSRFGASTSRFCLLARLRLLSTRKSSTTAYRVAICGGFAAFSEMTHRGMGVRICIPTFEESWGRQNFLPPFWNYWLNPRLSSSLLNPLTHSAILPWCPPKGKSNLLPRSPQVYRVLPLLDNNDYQSALYPRPPNTRNVL